MTEELYIKEVERLRPQMVATAMRYLGDAAEAEDLVQDSLLKLWTMHAMVVPSTVDRVAFTILRHLCIDELRRREYRRGAEAESIDTLSTDPEALTPEEIDARDRQLAKAVGHLPSRQRVVLQLRYLRGKSVENIARLIGSTEESVHMTLSRARKNVARLMAVVVLVLAFVLAPIYLKKEKPELAVVKPEKTLVRPDSAVSVPAVSNIAAVTAEPKTVPAVPQPLMAATSAPEPTPVEEREVFERKILVYSGNEDYDAYLEALISYEKTKDGYRVLTCDYIPVSDSGHIVTFIPEEEEPDTRHMADMRLNINGTLSVCDDIGNCRERYLCLNYMITE